MSELPKPVMDTVRKLGCSTMKEISEIMTKDMLLDSKAKTAQRRIYDVISILTAAGYLTKNQKYISINNNYASIQKGKG